MQSARQSPALSLNAMVIGIIIFVGGIFSGMLLRPILYSAEPEGQPVQEELLLNSQYIWVIDTLAEAAVSMTNNGTSAITINRITIRGMEPSWSDIYYSKGEVGSISTNLEPTPTEIAGNSATISIDGRNHTFTRANGPILLQSRWTMVIYVKNPGNITYADIPQEAVTIAIYTASKMYSVDAAVDVTFQFTATEQLMITNLQFGGVTPNKWIAVIANNTGTAPITINEVWINGVKQTSITYTPSTATAPANEGLLVNCTYAWVNGATYQVRLTTSKGNNFPYTAVAPTS